MLAYRILCSKVYQSLNHVSAQALIVSCILLTPADTGIVRFSPCLVSFVPLIPTAGRRGVRRSGWVAIGPLPAFILIGCFLFFRNDVPGFVHALGFEFGQSQCSFLLFFHLSSLLFLLALAFRAICPFSLFAHLS